MSSVYVIYWSGSGNTEAMANLIAKGIKEGGKNGVVKEVSRIEPKDLIDVKGFAIGCPSMGVEELEDEFMEPFVAELESIVKGKHVLLFGSYGWGDGEWMRNWVERMSRHGGILVNGEGIIATDEPDEEATTKCMEAGKKLAQIL